MPFRIFSVSVVLFWLASLAWLGAVVWAPPESRMTRVDPREVRDLLFSWNDTTTMAILEDGVRRGEMRFSAGSGLDPSDGVFTNTVSMSGTLQSFRPGHPAPRVDLFLRGNLVFSGEMEILRGGALLRAPAQKLVVRLSLEGAPPSLEASVASDGREIFRYGGGEGDSAPALSALPVPSFLPVAELAESVGRWEVEARTGSLPVAGKRLNAYLLLLRSPDFDQELRIYLSEAGEPLKIETSAGMEAVSEILAPMDAYRRASREAQR